MFVRTHLCLAGGGNRQDFLWNLNKIYFDGLLIEYRIVCKASRIKNQGEEEED